MESVVRVTSLLSDEFSAAPMTPLRAYVDHNDDAASSPSSTGKGKGQTAARAMPLVIRPQPTQPHSAEWLCKLVANHRETIRDLLDAQGAVLFRGFAITTSEDFEKVALAFEPNLSRDYLGTSPRRSLTDKGYVFTASELPRFFPIPQHCEMSFLPSAPSLIFFSCLKEPTTGGETPLCDFSRVAEDLDPKVKAKFEKHGVEYYRNYCGPNQKQYDPWMLKRWPEVFGSTDKGAVAKVCEKEGVKLSWGAGDALRLTNKRPAFKTHPKTGKQVWYNHSQVFHPSQAYGEYKRIFQHTRSFMSLLLTMLLWFVLLLKRVFQRPEAQGMNAFYGNGEPIPQADMEKVRDAVWKNMVIYKWQKGDVVIVDNQRVSHGRLPYTGNQRMVAVAWG